MPQPVSGPITVEKETIRCVCDAREDANRTLSVEYKRVRSVSSVSLVNVSFMWDVNGEAFRDAISVCHGGCFAYTHAHLLDY